MSLLTDCAIIGVGESGTTVASFTAAGTLIGTITLPEATNGKLGAIAASASDNRIYVLTGTANVRVYDQNGTLVTTIAVGETVRSLYVPEAGKLWVASHNASNGKVKEYNTSGTLVGTISDLTYIGGGYIEAGYGMFRYSGFLYYLSLRGAGFEVNSGVFKDDLATVADSVQVRQMSADTTAQPRRFAMASTGDFFVLDAIVAGGKWQAINRINSSGTFQQDYNVVSGTPEVGGIAVDDDGARIWAGDVTNGIIYRIDPTTEDKTSFSAVVNSSNCCSVLTVPFGSTPDADLDLEVACPTVDTGLIGQSFSSQVNATGGNPPYTFAIVDGALPPGLTLNTATGEISGTPTTAGTFTFSVSITESP